MTVPLSILAVFAVLLGFVGTPAWPWFQSYLSGVPAMFDVGELFNPAILSALLLSTLVVAVGIFLGWWLYGRNPIQKAVEMDVLEAMRPGIFSSCCKTKFYVDEFYEATVIRLNAWFGWLSNEMEYWLWSGAMFAAGYLVVGLSWMNRFIDEYVVNLGFDEGCREIRRGGGWASPLSKRPWCKIICA